MEKGLETKFPLRLPQPEYTRFPRAANEPPRATLLRGLTEAFGTGTAHCSSHRKPLRLLAPPKTFPPAGVSYIPVAGMCCLINDAT